jgi:hypothetical protein
VTRVSVTAGERAALWLALLRRFTFTSPSWLVWKQVDSALGGDGDIDSAAAPAEWDALEEDFFAWARDFELGPVTVCRHIPGGRNLIAIPPGSPTFLEVSIKHNKAFRGSTLFELEDLAAMSEMDERGFRRVRLGAEGLLKLVLNGSKWFGRENAEGLSTKRVCNLLASDPAGVAMAARLFGGAEPAARQLADAVVRGEWDPRAMRIIEAHAVRKALRHPAVAARRAWFRVAAGRRCPIVQAIGHGRVVGEPRAAWLDMVARTHPLDVATSVVRRDETGDA